MRIPHPNLYLSIYNEDSRFATKVLDLSIQNLDFVSSHYNTVLNPIQMLTAIDIAVKTTMHETIDNRTFMLDFELLDSRDTIEWMIREYLFNTVFSGQNGVIIEATSALNDMMEKTDIDDIKVGMLNMPYDLCYFNLNDPVPIKGTPIRGMFVHGVYTYSRKIKIDRSVQSMIEMAERITEKQYDGSEHLNLIDVIMISGQIKGSSEYDGYGPKIAFSYQMAFMDSSNEDLKNIMFDKVMENAELKGRGHSAPAYIEAASRAFKNAIYMSCKDARIIKNNELTEFKKRYAGLGQKKAAKMANRMNQKYDRIIVGPEHLQADQISSDHEDTDRKLAPHWRRGHIRNQKHGEGFQLNRMVWIQPTIVNKALTEDPVKPKTYKVMR